MQTIIMIYRLNKGVSIEEYKRFSLEIDQPFVKSFDSIIDFSVNIIEGPQKEWDVFEVMKINSYKDWEKISETEEMKKHVIEWVKYANEGSVKLFYGNKIE